MVRFFFTLGLLLCPLGVAEAYFPHNIPTTTPAMMGEQASSTTSSVMSSTSSEASSTSVEQVAPVLQTAPVAGSQTAIGSGELSRAAFTALLVRKLYSQVEIDNCYWTIAPSRPPHFTLLFSDVKVTDPYAPELCVAMRDGLIRGYGDGSFGPNRIVTFAESAKILSRTYGIAPYADADLVSPWYFPYVHALAQQNAIPTNIKTLNQRVTRGDIDEMLDRVHNHITNRPGQKETVLMPQPKPRAASTSSKPATTTTTSTASSKASAKSSVKAVTSTSSVDAKMEDEPKSSEKSLWDLF